MECDDSIDRTPWAVVGKLKRLTKPLPEMKALPLDQNMPMTVRPVPVCERIYLRDEDATARGEWTEVDALMPTRATPLAIKDRYENDLKDSYDEDLLGDLLAEISAACSSTRAEVRSAIAIEAAVPGAGKIYLIKSWSERTGQKATGVIVCPWNALVTQLVRASAPSHYTSWPGADRGHDHKKAYNLQGVTHIHFEEVYLLPVHQVGWMASFIKSHPNISVSMAGDPGQLAPVHQYLCVDSDT